MLATTLTLLLVIRPGHGLALNPSAVCSAARDAGYCAQILPMIDSVAPKTSLARLRRLIVSRGWPSEDLVGKEASGVALTVIERGSRTGRQPAGVARIWRGRVATSRAAAYERYLNSEGVIKMRAMPANLGVATFRRAAAHRQTEFIVVSYWPDREAIRAFAGADMDRPHPLPRDSEFLLAPATVEQHDLTTP